MESCTKPRLNALRFVAVTIMFGFAIVAASPARTQRQAQTSTETSLPKLEYEVASIKLDQSDHNSAGTMDSRDGFTATNASMKGLIQNAYGVNSYQLSGSPDWLSSERYVVDAKMDAATVDAMQKLSPHDQNLARQQMLRTLLADRLKLTIHRESKELPVYLLVIGRNGPKLQEAKPGAIYPNGLGPGYMTSSSNMMAETMTFQAMPISMLARTLEGRLGRTVLDKTGIAGNFDFTLKFSTDRALPSSTPGDSPDSQSSAAPLDPDAPFLLTAIQQQLGLKLESGKGPVEMIVIDHVERLSGN